jgi:hypothetical protein
MSFKQSDYETLLSEYSHREGTIALLKQYRPYLELIPSLRRPGESAIAIPLPVVRIRHAKISADGKPSHGFWRETIQLPCDLAILMCDPEWKIKLGAEILVFIHRPEEDFSELLHRWRKTQVYLDKDYEWLMPPREQHMLSEGAAQIHPLFVVFDNTPERIKRGLMGAGFPCIVQPSASPTAEVCEEELSLG